MLGKLIKYEWKATGRVLLPLYGIFLVTAILTNVFVSTNLTTITGIIALLFTAMSIVCIVMTLILLIQRFNTSLLQDEGYLMFTLPVSIPNLIFSKMIIALFWGIVGGLIGLLGGFFIVMSSDIVAGIKELFSQIQPYLSMLTWEHYTFAALLLVGSIVSYATFIMAIYASLSAGQLPMLSKYRRLAALGCFFVYYIIFINIASFIENTIFGATITTADPGNLLLPMSSAIIVEALFFTALFLLTHYILKNRLNLE